MYHVNPDHQEGVESVFPGDQAETDHKEVQPDPSVELIQWIGRAVNARFQTTKDKMSGWKGLSRMVSGSEREPSGPIDYPGVTE